MFVFTRRRKKISLYPLRWRRVCYFNAPFNLASVCIKRYQRGGVLRASPQTHLLIYQNTLTGWMDSKLKFESQRVRRSRRFFSRTNGDAASPLFCLRSSVNFGTWCPPR